MGKPTPDAEFLIAAEERAYRALREYEQPYFGAHIAKLRYMAQLAVNAAFDHEADPRIEAFLRSLCAEAGNADG